MKKTKNRVSDNHPKSLSKIVLAFLLACLFFIPFILVFYYLGKTIYYSFPLESRYIPANLFALFIALAMITIGILGLKRKQVRINHHTYTGKIAIFWSILIIIGSFSALIFIFQFTLSQESILKSKRHDSYLLNPSNYYNDTTR
jgi:hypothetical protein